MKDAPVPIPSTAVQRFEDFYGEHHGYLAIIVCTFGIIANILNIIVLTRKNMKSATNVILTGLAVFDELTMVAYVPFALLHYVLYGTVDSEQRNSLAAMSYVLFYANFSVVVHSISIWLTVVLAVFRYVSVKFPQYGSVWCHVERAQLATILVILFTTLACLPNFIITVIVKDQMNETFVDSAIDTNDISVQINNCDENTKGCSFKTLPESSYNSQALTNSYDNGKMSKVIIEYFSADVNNKKEVDTYLNFNIDNKTSSLATILPPTSNSSAPLFPPSASEIWFVVLAKNYTNLSTLNFWTQSLLFKILPCCFLTILSVLLIKTMREADEKRFQLMGKKYSNKIALKGNFSKNCNVVDQCEVIEQKRFEENKKMNESNNTIQKSRIPNETKTETEIEKYKTNVEHDKLFPTDKNTKQKNVIEGVVDKDEYTSALEKEQNANTQTRLLYPKTNNSKPLIGSIINNNVNNNNNNINQSSTRIETASSNNNTTITTTTVTNNNKTHTNYSNSKSNNSSSTRNTNRTTKMLVAVVVLFLITEFPQGVLMLFSGLSETFKDEVYLPLGDFIDIIALINNAINFILYCTMSKQFRDTFIDVLCHRCKKK